MFSLHGPVLAAIRLDATSAEPLRQAAYFALHYQKDLHVCHILPDMGVLHTLFPMWNEEGYLKELMSEDGVMDAMVTLTLQTLGYTQTAKHYWVERGSIYAAVLQVAKEAKAGMIVVGEGGGKQHLSQTAERIVRYAPCPVLVARESGKGAVLAATDYSDPAMPALEAGACEADHRRAELVLLHSLDVIPAVIPAGPEMIQVFTWNEIAREVCTFSGEQRQVCLNAYLARNNQSHENTQEGLTKALKMSPTAEVVAEEMTKAVPQSGIFQELQRLSSRRLDECVTQYQAVRGILAHGPAGTAIVEAARDLPAELVVVGTHGRSGLQRFFLGSVSEKVIREAHCSVLVVRLTSST